MNTLSIELWVFAGLFAALLRSGTATTALPDNTEIKAVNGVFARYPEGKKETSPISGYPSYTRVRPLQRSTFAPLREYFSSEQQRNIDQFLEAVSDLVNTRDQLARRLDIHEKWWPTGIDLLKVDAVLTQDLLTGRNDNPDKMSILASRPVDGKLEVTIQETYTEHGQDRVLGRGHRTSIVTLITEKDRWVIDEIKTKTTDAYGDATTETLTARLHDAVRSLQSTKRAMKSLPQTLDVKKGVKAKS